MIRVAIADDHDLIRDGFNKLLSTEPDITLVGEAKNAAELHQLLNSKDIDILVLDIGLPDKDGLEVLKKIRENELTKLIPVVILTSSKEESDLQTGYKNGCNSYVQKPVDFAEFNTAIKNLGIYWLLLNEPPPI